MQNKDLRSMAGYAVITTRNLAHELVIIKDCCAELFKPELTEAKKEVIKKQLIVALSLEVREAGVATLPEIQKDLITLSEYIDHICSSISKIVPQGFNEPLPGCTQDFYSFRRESRSKKAQEKGDRKNE